MADPSLAALQASVLAALKNASAIQALVGNPARVYGHVPQDTTASLYIVLADLSFEDNGDKTTKALAVTMGFDVVSRDYEGHGAVLPCMDAIYSTLHRASLSVTGNSFTLSRLIAGDTSRDDDGVTYRGSLSIEFLIRGT